TTSPWMSSALSALRIASTAAWSAAFSSPRPISLEAAKAAASLTRTASSARLRSLIVVELATASAFVLAKISALRLLDTDHARRFDHGLQLFDLLERAEHRRLLGVVGGQHHRHGFARRPAALQHRLQRHLLVAQAGRDIGNDARPVDHHQT